MTIQQSNPHHSITVLLSSPVPFLAHLATNLLSQLSTFSSTILHLCSSGIPPHSSIPSSSIPINHSVTAAIHNASHSPSLHLAFLNCR